MATSDDAGAREPGRDADPLRDERRITRTTICRLPDVSIEEARDYAAAFMTLPPEQVAGLRPRDPDLVRANVEIVRESLVRTIAREAGEVTARDYVAVEVERQSPAERARERDRSVDTVRNNIRNARRRLPAVADRLDGGT